MNQDLNNLLGAINSANRVLDNTYIQHAQRNKNKQQAKIHMGTQDMDRSDMGSFKKSLLDFMRQCHIEELHQNDYKFLEDDQANAQTQIEKNMPPDIPQRQR